MLFDLQSRRRRTAVKIIYSLLAVLMAGGLVLLGIGTGSGNGGALNAISHSGSTDSTSNPVANAAIKAAQKQITADPSSPAGYAAMIQARYEAAGTYEDSSTDTYSAAGLAQLKEATAAWTKYASLVKGTPNVLTVQLAAHAYDNTSGYSEASVLWQDYISANPTAVHGYECLAYTAYASKKTQLAQEATAKVLSLTPKIDQLETKSQLSALAKSKTEAGEAAAAEC